MLSRMAVVVTLSLPSSLPSNQELCHDLDQAEDRTKAIRSPNVDVTNGKPIDRPQPSIGYRGNREREVDRGRVTGLEHVVIGGEGNGIVHDQEGHAEGAPHLLPLQRVEGKSVDHGKNAKRGRGEDEDPLDDCLNLP